MNVSAFFLNPLKVWQLKLQPPLISMFQGNLNCFRQLSLQFLIFKLSVVVGF